METPKKLIYKYIDDDGSVYEVYTPTKPKAGGIFLPFALLLALCFAGAALYLKFK